MDLNIRIFLLFCAPTLGSYLGLVPYVMLLTGRGWRLISRVDRNHAIYLSRFAEPSDIAALQSSSLPARRDRATFPPKERSNPSLINLASLRQRQGSEVQDALGESDRIFELTQRSAREIAQSKKWYNRYRTVTDRQMMGVAALFMLLSIIVAISFQVHTPGVSVAPVIYVCHSGAEVCVMWTHMTYVLHHLFDLTELFSSDGFSTTFLMEPSSSFFLCCRPSWSISSRASTMASVSEKNSFSCHFFPRLALSVTSWSQHWHQTSQSNMWTEPRTWSSSSYRVTSPVSSSPCSAISGTPPAIAPSPPERSRRKLQE